MESIVAMVPVPIVTIRNRLVLVDHEGKDVIGTEQDFSDHSSSSASLWDSLRTLNAKEIVEVFVGQ